MDSRQDNGRLVGAFVLIGLGVLFLLQQFVDFSFIGTLWPFFIILPGLAFLGVAWQGGEKSAPLAYPGMIVTGTGLILLVQSITNRWESWAYAWALYPVFVGIATMFVGQRLHNNNTYADGRKAVNGGLIAFAIFAIFFEGFIFGGFSGVWEYALPVLLVGIGGYMLLQGRGTIGDSPAGKPKRYGGPSPGVDPDLQQKIDDAIDED